MVITGLPVSNASHPLRILPPKSTAGSSRLSLGPQSMYNHQDREPRTLSNADNYFKIRQNLHQGVSVNPHAHTPTINSFQGASINQHMPAANNFQEIPTNYFESALNRRQTNSIHQYTPASDLHSANSLPHIPPRPTPQYAQNEYPRQENRQLESPISQIANGMLFNRQLLQLRSQRPEPANVWQRSQVGRIDHLQPQWRENTPQYMGMSLSYSNIVSILMFSSWL